MVHSIRSLCLFIMIFCCVLSCGCTRYGDNTETSQSEQKSFEQSNIAPNFELENQSINGYETSTDSIPTNQSESSSVVLDNVNTENSNLINTPSDNWYIDGYIVPSNWLSIMTSEEAFEHFDEIIGESPSEKNIGEIIQNLMNRNVIAFEILYGRDPAYEFDDNIDPYEENADISNIHPIRSAYFNSLDDIIEIMNGTYTEIVAEERLNGSKGERKLFFEEDGKLFVDNGSMYYWSSDPFQSKTYIEITDNSENECIFVWHYVAWEPWDYEDNYTYEPYPYHMQKTLYAVIENNEWRLTSIVFDNREQ